MVIFMSHGIIFNTALSKEKIPTDNLVINNPWYISGPSVETEDQINIYRVKNQSIKITTNNQPTKEIELHVMVTPSGSSDGPATDLSSNSYLEVTYQSTHVIKLQAREGNQNKTGCIHGGSHPRIKLSASPNRFITKRINWQDFRLNENPNGKILDQHNLCKFNFVNYQPQVGSIFILKSMIIVPQ